MSAVSVSLLEGSADRAPAHRLARLCMAVLVAAGLALALPPPAALAADGVVETGATTYELVPEKGVLKVTINLRVRNEIPSGSEWYPCPEWVYDPWLGYYPVPSTCRRPIHYYINETYVWLERSARNIRITADRGAVSRRVEQRGETIVVYRISFQSLFRGQTRSIRITYEVPGGKPRSGTDTRIGRAYANFCVAANGLDGGTVRVVVPDAFEMEVWPEAMEATRSGGRVVYESGSIADTTEFFRCLEGTNEAGFARTVATSPAGRTVIIEGWPEDPEWREAMGTEVPVTVAGLEALIGRPLPGDGPITIRQVSHSAIGRDYAGTFDVDTGVARISETYATPGVVAHELAHAWFNTETFAATWMSEGLASWAERVSPTAGPPCTAPGPYPGHGSIDLDEWIILGPRATEAQRALVAYLYDASCWIATDLANRMGEERMGEVIRALLDRRGVYGDDAGGMQSGSGPVDWQGFLDAVDEIGLVPAGVADLEYAQDLLLYYGVAEPAELRGRAEARAAYHELAADLGAWAMPEAVRVPLEVWDFGEARTLIATAREVLELVRQADASLAGIGAATGPARSAFEEARDAGDLAQAREIAADQSAAALDVADALEALSEPRDPIEEIGMWGVDLEPVVGRAVTAVRAADATAAAAAADEIRDQLARATEVGTQRVGLAVGGVLVALLVAGAAVRVRRRRPAQPDPGLAIAGTVPEPLSGQPEQAPSEGPAIAEESGVAPGAAAPHESTPAAGRGDLTDRGPGAA